MEAWGVICPNCSAKIVHSEIKKENLSDFLLPAKPIIPAGATLTCPSCQTIVTYLRTDLRHIANP